MNSSRQAANVRPTSDAPGATAGLSSSVICHSPRKDGGTSAAIDHTSCGVDRDGLPAQESGSLSCGDRSSRLEMVECRIVPERPSAEGAGPPVAASAPTRVALHRPGTAGQASTATRPMALGLSSQPAKEINSHTRSVRGCQKTGSMKNRGYVVTSIRMCKQTTAAARVVQASIVVAERS